MRIANPNDNKPFNRVVKNKQGDDEYGYRSVDGSEEVVHIPTGLSNMQYYQPETIFDGSCNHEFRILDMGKREIECQKCPYVTSFHVNNLTEIEGNGFVLLNKKKYSVVL